jgi:hypothetical protein
MSRARLRYSSTFLFLPLLLLPAAGRAAENPKDCCKIIRVDSEKGTAWLRNPRTGMVAMLRVGAADIGKFKIDDRYNPDTSELNGAKTERRYPTVMPEAEPTNARVIRVKGAEVACEVNESKTVYRFYALKFGPVLSSIRPGQEIVVDEVGRWAFIRLEGGGKVKPSLWAFALD